MNKQNWDHSKVENHSKLEHYTIMQPYQMEGWFGPFIGTEWPRTNLAGRCSRTRRNGVTNAVMTLFWISGGV